MFSEALRGRKAMSFRIAGLAGTLAAFAVAAPAYAGDDTSKKWICHATDGKPAYALIHAPADSSHWTKHDRDKAPRGHGCEDDENVSTPAFTGRINLGLEPITARCDTNEFGINGWTLTAELYVNGELESKDSVTQPFVCVPMNSGPAGPQGPVGPQGPSAGVVVVPVPAVAPAPTPAPVLRRCHSRRRVTITVPRPIMRALDGLSYVRAIVAGQRQRLDIRDGKIVADFRGVREGTSSVTIRIRASNRRQLTMTRFYILCREGALGHTNVPPRTGE
jgi:hypothetical protein